ncbi:MAG: methyl-accepting chemotaxis protein [Chloroflexota bacterium]|jgi:methyl-accepting chemotaxis protein
MRLTIQTKLMAGFLAVLMLTGIVGYLGISNIGAVGGLMTSMYEDRLVTVENLNAATISLHRMRVNILEHLIADDIARMDEVEKKIADYEIDIQSRINKYSKTTITQEEKEWLAKCQASWPAYQAVKDDIIKLNRDGNDEQAMALFTGEGRQRLAPVQEALQQLLVINSRIASEANEQGKATEAFSRNLTLAVIAFTILLGCGIAFFISRAISSGVRKMALAADGLSVGDVDQKITVKGSDEVGQMARSFSNMIDYMKEMAFVAGAISKGDLTRQIEPKSEKDALGIAFHRMIENLRQIVGGLATSASTLTAASQQLSAASEQAGAATQQITTTIQQVARGTQEQSSSVQETSASVEQLSRAIDQIAKGAQDQAKSVEKASASVDELNASIAKVSGLSSDVQKVAQESERTATSGGDSVKKTLQGMAAIRESTQEVGSKIQELRGYSEQIGAIVDAIDDIAEQTNLLALNAAIEAARAGEHGRGFAVVADEVRKLAERSSRETKQIAELIAQVQRGTQEAVQAMEQGNKEVEMGSKLAEEAGEALKAILAGAQESAEQVNQIVAAVSQMEVASQQVVSLMDSVSAVIEESTAATEEMATSSQQVTGAIERISAVSEETSASAEEVSASTEEMSAQVEEMVAQAHSLAQMSAELQSIVAQFKTDDEGQQGAQVTMRRRKDDWQADQSSAVVPVGQANLRSIG